MKSQALKFGALVTETTPRATFRLVPSKARPSSTIIPYQFRSSRFRKPKRKGIKSPVEDIYIEKRNLRINTQGELRGITFAPRKKLRKVKRKNPKRRRRRK